MIEALIFDFDGLILDTETPELRAWQETFSRHGVELTLETWIDCVGRPPGTFDPCVHLEELVGRAIDREEARTATRARAHAFMDEEVLRPGVEGWLAEAKDRGLRLAVASSSSRRWVEGHLTRLGILHHFETLVCYEDVSRHKPDPEPYLVATRRVASEPRRAVAIEDSSHGLQSARAAGLWTVAVPNHVTHRSVENLGDFRLSSLAEKSLQEVLEEIDSSRGLRS